MMDISIKWLIQLFSFAVNSSKIVYRTTPSHYHKSCTRTLDTMHRVTSSTPSRWTTV